MKFPPLQPLEPRNEKSIPKVDHSVARWRDRICGGSDLERQGHLERRLRIVRRSAHRAPADTNELCRRGAQNDASSGGLWRGCSGSGRRLRGDTGMCAGRGCLRADLHEVLINPQASERSAFCQTELGCNMAREADFVLPRARLEPDGINVDDHHTGISRRGAWLLSQRGNAKPVRRLACGACGISTLCGEAHAGMYWQ